MQFSSENKNTFIYFLPRTRVILISLPLERKGCLIRVLDMKKPKRKKNCLQNTYRKKTEVKWYMCTYIKLPYCHKFYSKLHSNEIHNTIWKSPLFEYIRICACDAVLATLFHFWCLLTRLHVWPSPSREDERQALTATRPHLVDMTLTAWGRTETILKMQKGWKITLYTR